MAASVGEHDGAVAQACTIEATVPTGFESVASDEAREMFETDCKSARGKITFQTPVERVKDILNLGGIDHCRVLICHEDFFGFNADAEDCLSRLQLLVKACRWQEGLSIWSKFYSFDHPIPPEPEVIPGDEELIDVCYSVHMPGQKANEGSQRSDKSKRRGKRGKQTGGNQKAVKENWRENKLNVAAVPQASDDPLSSPEIPDFEGVIAEEAHVDGELKSEEGKSNVEKESSRADTAGLIQTETLHSKDTENFPDITAQQSPEKSQISEDSGDLINHAEAFISNEKSPPGSYGDAQTSTDNRIQTYSQPIDCAVQPLSHSSQNSTGNSINPGEIVAETDEACPQVKTNCTPVKKTRDPSKPAFRVTCNRAGENHCFDSMSAAASFGSAVQKYFGWNVDMTNYNIEIVLNIDNNEVSVGMALTPESLHRRNLVAFGVTTLRPTICHNMLRMVKIMPGHIVCDPLCGTGSISIQGALRFPAFQLCGDNHNVAMEKTSCNKEALNTKKASNGSGALMMDAVQWDACYLPLRDGMVDVFVSDLPFGKRVGKRFSNQKLYRNLLDEMARCGKLTGRAALLTGDLNNMVKAIQAQKYWTRRRCYSCSIGGIAAAVFLLYRTLLPYSPAKQVHLSQQTSYSVQNQQNPSDQNHPLAPSSDQNHSLALSSDQNHPPTPSSDQNHPLAPSLDQSQPLAPVSDQSHCLAPSSDQS